MFLDILSLEKKFKIQLEAIEEWNYLRNYYRECNQTNKTNDKTVSLLKAIKDAFYGFSYWFRRYDYLIFSDSSERKKINGKLYDIKADIIIEYLGNENTLLVETPAPIHNEQSLLITNYIVSRRFIDLLTVIMEKIFYKTCTISLLEKINQELNIDFDYKKYVYRFNTQYNIYKFWFNIIKPTHIFLNCYYDKQHIIKAAHDLGIQIVEIQHGIISHSHSAYYSPLAINAKYIPDYLLSFGENLKEEKNSEFIFSQKNVFPVGSYYLEYLKKTFKNDPKLSKIIWKYRLVVGVSLQWTVENELILMLNKVANLLPEVLFILIPRKWDEKKYNNLELSENMIFYPKLDCYQTIMHCNYHCTVYSTCALEAPSLGIPNILVNLNNLTNKYIYNMFKESNICIVNTEAELIEILQEEYIISKENLIENNEFFYINNYRENIRKIIYQLKKDTV